ncbi:MAG: FtsQ-type POTRA domain-containing protein [Desulfobacterales bacterium]|nr:FtsQ-type POTRA domain-containing protein [Desulfobacterales bacterium]
MRQNYYKNSLAKRRAKVIQRIISCFKIIVAVSLMTAMSVVFIFGYDLLTQCDYFRANSIIVKGTSRLSQNQIIKHSGIDQGINIFSVNLFATRKRLLAHPWIADAEVRRELPDGINIRIKEHKPLAVIDLGRKFLINDHGEIFKELAASDPSDLPVIIGLEFSDLDVSGKSRNIPFNAVMHVLELGQKPGSIIPNKLLKVIRVDREIGITLYAFDGIKAIKLGYNNYPNKYERLKNVLFYMEKGHVFSDFDTIDLKNLDRIVVNPVRIGSPAMDYKEA